MFSIRAIHCAALTMSLAGPLCMSAWCAPSRVVYVPLTFDADQGPVRAKACMQVTERSYPDTEKWQGFGSSADGAEKAMDALIAILKSKDQEGLMKASDPLLGRDPKQFDEQAKAYFAQLETGEIMAIPKAYEVGDFVVFFGRLHWINQTFSSPFIFHRQNNGTFGFLPYRTNDLDFRILREWYDAPWGPSKTAQPDYCPAASIAQFNFRVPASASLTRSITYLWLKGAPASESKDLLAALNKTLQGMKKALGADNWIEPFEAYMTPRGAERLAEWYKSAAEDDKKVYKTYITEQEPFFIFDASPVVILYTTTPSHLIQVMYFEPSNGALVWTNSARATVADKLFKSGPLFSAATEKKPFGSLEIK